MTKQRITAALAVMACALGAMALKASAAPGGLRTCGAVKAAAVSWTVDSAGVSCSTGKRLVRKLAARPHSVYTKLGTFIGLKCVEIAGRAKREIACVSSDGRRSVYAITKEDA